jgi:hypothetical protein
MERYCGSLRRGIQLQSRRHVYTSINHFILDNIRLSQVKMIYNLQDHQELNLRQPPEQVRPKEFQHPKCE